MQIFDRRYSICNHMETFDGINTFKEEDAQLFDSLLDDVRVAVRFENCRIMANVNVVFSMIC